MKKNVSIFLLSTILLFSAYHTFSQNAPITTAGSVQACPDSLTSIPIIVDDFTSISALTLRLDYDPSLLTYANVTHINPILNITGVFFYQTIVSPNVHMIKIAWTDLTARTLPNGSKLFDIQLYYISGSPTVSFNNTSNAGGDCEYAGGDGYALNDMPTATYYIDAQITGSPQVGPAGTIAGTSTVCQGQAGVIYTVPAIPNAQWYTLTIPSGGTIVSGSSSNSITVDFSTSASSGNISVFGSNLCGGGTPSPDFPLTVDPLPDPAGTITGTATVSQGQTGVVYTVPPIPNAQWYTWTVPAGATIVSGSLSNSISVDFSATASSGIITVYGSNACGDGALSPPFPVTVGMATQIELTNIIIPNGTTICYDATQTIILAGNGTYFTVENGGSVTLIAGLNIKMLPGTTVQPGGYMHAYITTTGQFCPPVPPIVAVNGSEGSTEGLATITPFTELAGPKVKIYPNPTSGSFTMEFTGLAETTPAYVEIYSIMGNKIISRTFSGTNSEVFNLSEKPAGLYFVKIASEGFSRTLKVVKQ